MAVTEENIGSGQTYSDIDVALADVDADPAIGDYWILTCVDATNYSSGNAIDASNANNAPHQLLVDSSVEFTADSGWPTCADVEGTSARVVAADVCFYLDAHHWTLTGFLISSGANDAALELGGGDASNWMIKRFCGYDSAQFAWGAGSGGATFGNCFTWNCGTTNGAYLVSSSGAYMELYNCTHSGGVNGIKTAAPAGSIKCYGVISLNTSGSCFLGQFGAASADADYCVSDDNTANTALKCTNYKVAVTPTDWVENITGGSEDLHYVYSGASFGDDYSATIGTIDIDGDSGANQGDHVGADYPATGDQALTATTISLVFDAPAASVAAGGVTLTASTISAVLNDPAASIAASNDLAASTISISLTAPAASITAGGVTLTASTISIVLNAPAGSISLISPQTLTATTISVVLNAPAGSIALTSGPQSVTASTISVVLNAPAAGISAAKTLAATVQSVVLAGPSASIEASAALAGMAVSVVLEAPAGTLLPGGVTLTASVASVVLNAPAAILTVPQALTATVVSVVLSAPAGSLSAFVTHYRVVLEVTDRNPLIEAVDRNPLIEVPFRGGS